MTRHLSSVPVFAIVLTGMSLLGCSGSTAPSSSDPVNVQLRVQAVVSVVVSSVVVQVTGEGIVSPLIFNLQVSNGTATGTLTVPVGSDRTITVRAYDGSGIETHRGSVTVDVLEGVNPTVSINLIALNGDLPIIVNVGTFIVTVVPDLDTVAVGFVVRLLATVVDTVGDTLSIDVQWATMDPSIATVDVGNGEVTGLMGGDVQIVATYAGVGDAMDLHVLDPGVQMAFASDRDGNLEIYTMAPDGTNQTRLTSNAVIDQQPAMSPDGTRIAFRSLSDVDGELFVMDVDGSNVAQVTSDGCWNYAPAWSSDMSRIVYTCGVGAGNNDIFVINVDGTGTVQLTAGAQGNINPSWSPDGSQIVFESSRDGNAEIYVMNVDGTNQIRLTSNVASDNAPTWSPDGTQVAFRSDRDGNAEIYVMDADGSNQTRLTNNAADETGPSWSPDGVYIVFQTDRDGSYEVYLMNSDGSNPVRLTNNVSFEEGVSWGSN